MQIFPPLCIYNFGLSRRTPSPRPPTPRNFSTSVRPPCHARPPSLPRAPALQLPCVPAVPPAAVRVRPPSSCRARPPSLPRAPALQLPREGSLRRQGVARLLQQGTSMALNLCRPCVFMTTHRTGGGATTETRARPRTATYAATSGRVRGHGAGMEVDLPSRGPFLGGGRRWMEPN